MCTLLLVVLGNRRGLGVILLQTSLEGFGIVIWSLDEWLTSLIILTFNLWWIELHVVGSARGLVDPSALDTLDQDVILDLELQHLVDLLSSLFEHGIEFAGLLNGPWESIQKETLGILWLFEFFFEERDDEVVTDKSTGLHNCISLLANLGAGGDGRSEKVAGGDVSEAVFLADDWALGSLATAWWTQQNDVDVVRRHIFWILVSCKIKNYN